MYMIGRKAPESTDINKTLQTKSYNSALNELRYIYMYIYVCIYIHIFVYI
jgi:hypothetical protein